ncbi:MAG: hypothetical protein CUN57_03080, partial [Phototrophicales bacterium]
ADVVASNDLFPTEFSTSPIPYFYANKPTGSVELDNDKSSPVAAIAQRKQLLYAVTGGGYTVRDKFGNVQDSIIRDQARLIISDISDPVAPMVLEKEPGKGYHFDTNVSPAGFNTIRIKDNDL